jgi:hypothetical protein
MLPEKGPTSAALVPARFGDRVLIRMYAEQGVLGLQKKYGEVRLEAARSRAYRGTPDLNVVTRSQPDWLQPSTTH